MAPKTKVEPDMATYWFNSMLYKFLIKIMHGTTICLPGRIRPASKTPLKLHKKQMLYAVQVFYNKLDFGRTLSNQ